MKQTRRLLEQIAGQSPHQVWVVGGVLRDHLLQAEGRDMDLVVADAGSPLLGLDYWLQDNRQAFWLDQGRRMIRLVLEDQVTVDLALMQGADLREDLGQRDFTVNSMALTLEDWLRGDLSGLIDPYQGRDDLMAKRLRIVQPGTLLADPVRVLRAVRLGVSLGLSSDQQTTSALIDAAPALADAPGERVWAELALILVHKQAPSALAELERFGAAAALFPEVAAMQRVGQNRYHQFTVDVHSQRAFAAFCAVIHDGDYVPPAVQIYARRYWDAFTQSEQAAIMLAAWLHDIGKSLTRSEQGGKITFYEHEHVGARMASQVAERLRLNNEQAKLVHTFITFHMYPMQLWRTGHLDERLIHRLYRRTGALGVAIVLFTLADHLAKGEQVALTTEFQEHQQVVERLLVTFFCQHEQIIAPKPLLDGEEIMAAVGKPAGPWVGESKAALLEAQAAGRISDRQQAVQFVQSYVPKRKRRRSK